MQHIGNILNRKKWQPKSDSFEGLPIRPPIKQTRLYLDNEYYEGGYAAMFPHSVTTVYGWLARRAKQKTQICYPSAKDIMERCGITNRNTVFEALKFLETYNIIFIVHRSKGHVPNVYALLNPSNWKPINSSNFDTVIQQIKKKQTVSNRPAEQYQNQPPNSGKDETRSHITESNNEIKEEIKKNSINGKEILQRLSGASKSVILPYFREEDIISALEEINTLDATMQNPGYKLVWDTLLRRGAIPIKEIPTWLKIKS